MDDVEVFSILKHFKLGTYRFSPMRRTFIPKPNKPGDFRPITQPHEADLQALLFFAAFPLLKSSILVVFLLSSGAFT
jgi:retron-type reverse transcriptase